MARHTTAPGTTVDYLAVCLAAPQVQARAGLLACLGSRTTSAYCALHDDLFPFNRHRPTVSAAVHAGGGAAALPPPVDLAAYRVPSVKGLAGGLMKSPTPDDPLTVRLLNNPLGL